MRAYRELLDEQGFSVPFECDGEGGLTDDLERLKVRAEIDVVVARDLFGLTKDQMSHILDTFGVLRRAEEDTYGRFLTKELVLDGYSAG